MLWYAVAAFATLLASTPLDGVRLEITFRSTTTMPNRPERSGQGTRTLEIDGPRFRITGATSSVETSLDDGATSFFGDDRTRTQSRLTRDTTSGSLAGITGSVENETVSVGSLRPGPVIAGIPTQQYTVDHDYVLVLSVPQLGSRRMPTHHHYEIAVADIASPSAFRVILSRGFGGPLATHSEAFRGFPMQLEARLVEGDTAAPTMTTNLHMSVTSITPWSWPPEQ